MIELHPAVVHFPIALITIAALFGAMSLFTKKELFKQIAFWNLLLGVIGGIAAVLTGLIEEQNLTHNDEIHQVLVKHKFTGFGILILSFALLTWIWVRKNRIGKGEYITWVLFLVIGTAAVFYQGFLGGKMVFEQGAGVKPIEQYREHGGDSTKPHSHSNLGHDHGSAKDATSPDKTKPQHDHSTTPHEHTNKQDTSKKQDSVQSRDKKKALKDMKY
ncbi:DUF2231 domain-containing protein [Pseudoflavitalea sp. X16]|uniref:DUF2231 domain-containing protein n=1 Tax=Paraflavitalea devenefica TaxID=2716334 RepID=UPI00142403C0|nr:DUF2231 domain-containing protein [Paraflavitalea devenefica]NII26343.1 DUF2231 domain-containing protein [Paraflavitalea devenefica]